MGKSDLDSPERELEIRHRIREKAALRKFYREIYRRYRDVIERSPAKGEILELGSGGGFAAEVIPGLVTSDLIPYAGVDRAVNALEMPYGDGTLRTLLMHNVLHHIPDCAKFFQEASRCLKPGGRLLIVDHYPGWIGRWIYRYGHHEAYDEQATEWKFPSTGPLSGANGALAWIIFVRDRAKFEKLYPQLRIASFTPHTPLRYWLTGGLKRWSLLPGWAFGLATAIDRALCAISPRFASFVDIEIVKT